MENPTSSSSSTSFSSSEGDYIFENNNVRKIRTFQERINMDYYTDSEFKRRFRFSKSSVEYLALKIDNDLKHEDNRGMPLTPQQQVMVALRYYATASYQIVVGDLFGISQSAACTTIHKVSKAFARLSKEIIKMPSTEEQINKVINDFYKIKKIPLCIGSIDGSHIPIKSPGGDNAELFRNRKGWFSINVQAICDANYKILDLVARWHGFAHDQTIFNYSHIQSRFESGEFNNKILVGDAGYGCTNFLINPYRNPASQQQQRFNNAVSCTRGCIERCFGQWKKRFPVISKASDIHITNMLTIIVATAVLHNIAIDSNDFLSDDEEEIDPQEMPLEYANTAEYTHSTAVRDRICNTF